MKPSIGRSAANPAIVWAVIIAVVFQIGASALPAFGIGDPIGSQSNAVRTLITPAGWAFAIWGPLYAGSVVFAIYQALPAQKARALPARIRLPAAGAFFANGLWALYTQFNGLAVFSVPIILFGLSCLIAIYRVFARWQPPFSTGERWCAVLPLSALAAWLTAAAIVNIAATLLFYGVGAGDPAPLVSALVVLTGGIIASLAIARGRGNPIYAAVFLWALSAIYAAGGQQAEPVAIAAGVAAVLVIIGTAIGLRAGGLKRWFGGAAAGM
ncbi:MAG: hypothetical protein GW855_11315 [Erythrobacter sp.]|nr:hypothetical protein [Erythrobacter sp.]NCQ62319.1 hypothetical protein [Alphaproteobacteria bacterium]